MKHINQILLLLRVKLFRGSPLDLEKKFKFSCWFKWVLCVVALLLLPLIMLPYSSFTVFLPPWPAFCSSACRTWFYPKFFVHSYGALCLGCFIQLFTSTAPNPWGLCLDITSVRLALSALSAELFPCHSLCEHPACFLDNIYHVLIFLLSASPTIPVSAKRSGTWFLFTHHCLYTQHRKIQYISVKWNEWNQSEKYPNAT